jgi:hypothetical protein
MLKISLGFYEPTKGPVLMDRMRRQAERFGTTFVDEPITKFHFFGILHFIELIFLFFVHLIWQLGLWSRENQRTQNKGIAHLSD